MTSQLFEALLLAAFVAAYFLLPYIFLKRGWIAWAGFAMLAIAIAGIFLVAWGESGFGGIALVFLLLPLPLILILVGIIMRLAEKARWDIRPKTK